MHPGDIVTTDGVVAQMSHAKWEQIKARIAELEAALRPFADVLRDMRSRGLDPASGNYVNADVETAAYLAAERLVGAD